MAYRNTLLALLVGILLAATTSAQQRYTVSGTVMEAGSRETLIGATVTVPGKAVGVATNGYGFYTLALPAADSVVLEFSYVGYATQRHTVALRGNVVLNVELELDMMQIDEIEVVAESKTSSRSTQTSVVELPIKQLKAIPMLLGEKDLLRAFQLMPGVQSGGEGTSGARRRSRPKPDNPRRCACLQRFPPVWLYVAFQRRCHKECGTDKRRISSALWR